MSALIETADHGDIREIRLARAPVNALDTDLCRALIEALNAALDHGVRGIVLAGNPKIFSAGMDVPYLMSLGDDRKALLDAWQAFSARRTPWRNRVCRWWPRSPATPPPAAACWLCVATIG